MMNQKTGGANGISGIGISGQGFSALGVGGTGLGLADIDFQ